MNDEKMRKLNEIVAIGDKFLKPLDELEKARESLPEGKEKNLLWYHLGKARFQVMLALSRMCGEDIEEND